MNDTLTTRDRLLIADGHDFPACALFGRGNRCTCDAQDDPTINLDMDRVTRQALGLRRFRVECDADGSPFFWEGEALSEAQAIRQAAAYLANTQPMLHVDRIKATSCIEVAA